jgi:hypothetical protein
MALEDLQDLMDASKAAASPFTRQLEGDERTAQEVQDFVNHTRNLTLAVVRRDGLPHAAPVIGGCVDGEIHVTISPGSLLASCLKRSPEVAFTMADLIHNIIGAGAAHNLGRVSDLGELPSRLDEASPFGSFAPEGWDGLIFRLEPRRLFAF